MSLLEFSYTHWVQTGNIGPFLIQPLVLINCASLLLDLVTNSFESYDVKILS